VTPAEAEARGRRYLTAGGRWRSGMLSLGGIRITVIDLYPIGVVSNLHRARQQMTATREDDVPDLRDAATRGCVLEEVREAWGNPRLWVEYEVDATAWWTGDYALGWACLNNEPVPPEIHGDSEADVLIAALEGAAHAR
jgi:hypothetical protein